MQVISVCGVEHKVTCNAFTPIVYSAAFKVEKSNGLLRPKDITEAIGVIAESMSCVGIPAIVPLLEIFWAIEKTADRSLEVFDQWLGKFPADAYDLTQGDGWASDVMQIIEQNYFPGGGQDVVSEGAEKPDADTAGRAN